MPTRKTAAKGERNRPSRAADERPGRTRYDDEDRYERDDDLSYQEDEDEISGSGERYEEDEDEDDYGDEAEPYDEGDDESDDQGADDARGRRRARPARRGGGGVDSAAAAAQVALSQIPGLTGRQPEGVTAVMPAEDGWMVGVEVVEDRRVPSAADILAVYETQVGFDGDLVSYRRTRRYSRGRGDETGGGG